MNKIHDVLNMVLDKAPRYNLLDAIDARYLRTALAGHVIAKIPELEEGECSRLCPFFDSSVSCNAGLAADDNELGLRPGPDCPQSPKGAR